MKTLQVTLTETRFNKPLVVIDEMPGPHVEMSPDAVRAFANALLQAATDCEARDLTKKHLNSVKKTYAIGVSA
ncbi:hypothetical protein ACO0LF_12280 [Undibacterium sp. Di27W]|uniref:hypothetical protein n=1 Tax=Undibacterium sp. Di27W TaxID=3413036 RepID=UPI003BEFBE50